MRIHALEAFILSEERVRLASVGLGSWAHVLAEAAQRGDRIDLVNCYSRSEESRAVFRQAYGVPRASGSLDALLSDSEIEGVVVTTPNDIHEPIILECLDAGVPVFTEKPIADTLTSAASVARAVDASGVLFAVGHSARRLGGHRVMKRWIDEGRLGGVSMAECNFTTARGLSLTDDSWRFYTEKSPGGSLIQLGVHHADTLQYLLGPVQAVSGHVRRLHTPAEVPDTTMSVLEFESGALAYLGAGWASPGVYQLRLQGTEANLFYDLDLGNWSKSHLLDEASTLESRHRDGRQAIEIPHTDMFREELEEFAWAIRGQGTIEVGADEAIRALAVVEAAIESSRRRGQAIELDPLIAAARV